LKKILIIFSLTIQILFSQYLYSQTTDTLDQVESLIIADSNFVGFANPSDFNESPHFNIPITKRYTQFPYMSCRYVLFDMSNIDNLIVMFKGKEIRLNKGTKVIFRVTNLDEIWCKGREDRWIDVRFLK
jgi:hypothetical protein